MTTPSAARLARVARRLVVALVAVTVLLGLGLVLAGDRIYPPLLEFVARTGADLHVTTRGPVTVEFGSTLRLTASDVDVEPLVRGDWQTEIGDIGLDIDAMALLRGRLRLDALTLDDTRLRIRRSEESGADASFGLLAGAHTRVQNLDITVEGDTPADRHVISIQHAEVQPVQGGRPQAVARGSIDGHALSIDARLATRAEAVDGGMSYPLQGSLEVAGWNLEATLDGHLAQPTEGRGLALQVEAQVSDVAPLAALLGTPWPSTGSLSFSASLAGDLPSPRLLKVTARLEDGNGAQARIEGAGISLASREVERLDVHYEGPLPAGLLDTHPGLKLEADVSLAGRPGDYSLTVDSLQALLVNDARLTASGTLALRDGAGVSLDSTEFDKLDMRYEGALPAGLLENDPGLQFAVSVSLAGKPGDYRLGVDSLQVSLPDSSRLTATGTLALETFNHWASARSQLHLVANVANLASLAGLTGITFPAVELVSASGDLTGTLGNASIENLRAEFGASGHQLATTTGRLGPLRLVATDGAPETGASTDLQVVLAPTDSRELDALLDIELKPPGTWSGQWRVQFGGNDWRLGSLALTAGREDATRIRISGDANGRGAPDAGIKRILTGAAEPYDLVDLHVAVETHSARDTARLLGLSVPALGAMKMHSRLLVDKGHYALQDIDLQSLGELGLTVRGSIGALRTFDDVDLRIAIAPTPSQLVGQSLDLVLPVTAPIAFDLTLRHEAPQPLRIAGDAHVGSSDFKVDVTAEYTGQRPLVKGSIHAAVFATGDFWPAEPAAASITAASGTVGSAKAPATGGPLGILGLLPGMGFVLREYGQPQQQPAQDEPTPKASQQASETPADDGLLPWRRLQGVDVDIAFRIDELRGRTLSAGPLEARLVDTGGLVELGPLNLHFKGGSLELHGVADANANPPTASFHGRGVDIPLAELVADDDALASDITGDLSFDYEMKTAGLTVPELRSSVSGEIRAVLENGQLPLSDLRLASGSLGRWMLTWTASDKRTPVPCAVAQFEIEGGIATAKTLFLSSSAADVYGAGTVDLRSDTLDLRATPKSSGLSVGRPLTIHISGPISAPTINTENTAAVLMQYGSSVAGSALLPASILFPSMLDLFDNGESSPCK